MWQRGQRSVDPVDAWAAAARGAFDPLYPFGHNYLGHLDLVRWTNVTGFLQLLISF